MENYQTIMNQYYARELYTTIFISVLALATFIFIIIAIIKWDLPKWFLLFWLIIVPIIIFSFVELKSIKDDIRYSSYVTYEGEYLQIKKGLEIKQTTVIYIDGKEKWLVSLSSITSNGTFYGYVVYSERSGRVVYVGDNPPD